MCGEAMTPSDGQVEVASGVQEHLQLSLPRNVAGFAENAFGFEIFFLG